MASRGSDQGTAIMQLQGNRALQLCSSRAKNVTQPLTIVVPSPARRPDCLWTELQCHTPCLQSLSPTHCPVSPRCNISTLCATSCNSREGCSIRQSCDACLSWHVKEASEQRVPTMDLRPERASAMPSFCFSANLILVTCADTEGGSSRGSLYIYKASSV